MAKWYGEIGFVETTEVEPGIWNDVVIPRNYYGDLIKNSRRLQNSGNVNDDVILSNELSIVSDPYANEKFYAIRYAVFHGVKLKVTSVDVQYPRLILSIGGVYNGNST